jgi:hypothetical protein
MGPSPAYDPVKETEYLVKLTLEQAQYDNTLAKVASTYDYQSDRINMGTAGKGPRIINFAPILQAELLPINRLIQSILRWCEETFAAKVEIEFAITIDPTRKNAFRFGLLQVRPMAVFQEIVDIEESHLAWEKPMAASRNVMGNGCVDWIQDIVYVVPETFQLKNSKAVAVEITGINRQLVDAGISYALIGPGRWGTSDPWLGIPVEWGQISGARVIIETQLPGIQIDLSQGSHFFHNMSNLGVLYFSLKKDDLCPMDWKWLDEQKVMNERKYIRHIRLKSPLKVKVDGRKPIGAIFK